MNKDFAIDYNRLRADGAPGFYAQKRGLTAVWGKEAVQFLNGLLTNDVAKLEDGAQLLAAFPNAQGRLLAIVRVKKTGDKFLFETAEETRDRVFGNLFRFTFAGDFFVEDLSEKYSFFRVQNAKRKAQNEEVIEFETAFGADYFIPDEAVEEFKNELKAAVEISDELYELLRIENGVPLYGKDMDETTIVPELGIDELISYNKGCYIGQEIIARIHFRGHVAKQMRGLVFEDETSDVKPGGELKTIDGKNAGKITSAAFSPKLGKNIALGYVRYDYLAENTELKVDEAAARVKNLPFLQ